MESNDIYLSVSEETQSAVREKASKFLGYVYPVANEDEVKSRLDLLRKEFYNANHHCYAYRLGHPDHASYRINDDGEPSGSAGKPIYGQILSRDLSDLLVVVVRYFGGTKLGIPGLIKAYKQSASLALDEASVIRKVITTTFEIVFPVLHMNEVMKVLKQEEADILSQGFRDEYSIQFSIRRSKSELISSRLSMLGNISTCE